MFSCLFKLKQDIRSEQCNTLAFTLAARGLDRESRDTHCSFRFPTSSTTTMLLGLFRTCSSRTGTHRRWTPLQHHCLSSLDRVGLERSSELLPADIKVGFGRVHQVKEIREHLHGRN